MIEAVGDRAAVVAGVGTNDTAHTIELARQAERAGADGLLVVTPYYNKPPQDGLFAHFTAVADATGLPVLLYDIPGRTGMPIATDTLVRLAEHPRIVGGQGRQGRPRRAASCGAWPAPTWSTTPATTCSTCRCCRVGAAGFVSVVGHVAGDRLHEMIDAHAAGDVARARAIHYELLPVYTGLFRTQGVIMTKAALAAARPAGRPGPPAAGERQ